MKEPGLITRRAFSACVAALPALVQAAADQEEAGPLRQLRAGHPRLLLQEADFDRVRLLVREHPLARRIFADFEKECDRLLSIPPVEYKLTPRLLPQARRVMDRVTTLSLMYRLTGREPWLRRAVMELNAAAAFRDWNPQRFNDTAEMSVAFSLGYDWLYNALTADERATIRDAIVNHALNQAAPIYEKQERWVRDRFSANIVANSAMAIAALAVADDVPEKSGAILRAALQSIPLGLTSWTADGGWPEGPAYSEYSLRYACLFFASLDTALGADFNMSGIGGVAQAGRFRMYTTGPAGRAFNYGDGGEDAGLAPELYWLGRRFGVPQYCWSEQRQLDRFGIHAEALDLAWFNPEAKSPTAAAGFPLDAVFRGVQVASFRGSWEDSNAIFLAVKGGDNKAPRAHFDLGAFVLDAGGVRWASDLGPDDSGSSAPRSSLFRVRSEAHNLLVIDGENQDPRAEARIVKLESAGELAWVQIDLSRSHGPKSRQWTRRIGLAQRQAVLIADSIRSEVPVEAMWTMLTEAEITLNGSTATLHRNGWTLAAEIRTPRHAVFDSMPARPPAGQSANTGFRRLIVRLGDKVTDLDLNIVLTPYRDGQPKPRITTQFPG